MRILYLASWFDTPGRLLVENVAARADLSVAVMCDYQRSQHQFGGPIASENLKSRGKLDLAAVGHLRRRLVEGQFDVVHTMSGRLLTNTLLATEAMQRHPRICGFVGFIGRFSRWNPIHRLSYLHPRVAAICCNCQAAAQPLAERGVTRDKLFTIYPGHPFQERPSPPDLDVRRDLRIPSDALVVGFAGNMRPVKGVDLLLQAAIKLANDESIHWLLLGRVEDDLVKQLAAHPAIRDRVHCLGWRDDAQRLMTSMDLFAMPSRSEGFSRGIMEAMELGLCPVVTGVGGTPELVRNGVDGLVVPPNDSAAIATAIRRLAADVPLRKSLAASARERIRNTFTADRMVSETLAMYDTMLDRPTGRKLRPAA